MEVLATVRGLDWKTRASAPIWAQHRRITWAQAACILLSIMVWWLIFPDVMWFAKLWAAGATGAFAGTILGMAWQLSDADRVPLTSGKYLVTVLFGIGAMATIAVALLAPGFASEEEALRQMRTLSGGVIAQVEVCSASDTCRSLQGRELIAFLDSARDASLLYRSHETSLRDCELVIHFGGGRIVKYQASVPAMHEADLALSCAGCMAGEVLISGQALCP